MQKIKQEKEIILNVKKAYYSALKAKELLKIAEEEVNYAEKYLEITKAKFKEGKIPEIEVRKSKISLANSKEEYNSAKNVYTFAMLGLNLILGVELDKEYELLEDTAYSPIDITYEKALNTALNERLEIKEMFLTKELAKLGIKLANSQNKPNIALSGSYNLTGDKYPPDIKSWAIGIGLNYPFYDSGETSSKIKQARCNLNQQEIAEEETKKQITYEVKQLWLKLKEIEEKINVLQETLKEAEKTKEITEIRYKEGLASSIEVYEAALLYKKAKVSYISSIYDHKIAKAELEKAMGK